jgi:STE24 endopeptidase
VSTASDVQALRSVDPLPLDRRLAWTLLALGVVLLLVLAWWWVPWSWVPGKTLRTPAPGAVFTPAQIARSDAFTWPVRYLSWSSLAVSLLVAAVLGLTPLGARAARSLGGRRWWTVALAGTFAFCVVVRLVTLPFALLVRRRSLDAGLTNQGIAGWARDALMSFGLTFLVSAVLVLLVVGVARRSPRRWFVPVGGLLVLLTFAVSYVYPVVVEPLFNRFTPLPDGALRTSILRLADREGVPVDDVLVADASRRTTTLNAYVSGFGDTRRVVLYDTLTADLPPAQIRSVVAHELGHARHDDVLLGTSLGAVGAMAGTCLLALVLDARVVRRRAGVTGAGDPAVAALVLAAVAWGSFLASPAQNTVSRAIEARADRAALVATDDPVSFDRLQRQLALHSLADPAPPSLSQFWFGSHPTVLQRIAIAEAVTGEPYTR